MKWTACVVMVALAQGCPGEDDTPRPTDPTPGEESPTPALETPTPEYGGAPFGARLVSFDPGEGAGFGQESLPDVVLGPPLGAGHNGGSVDVLSLGIGGEIVLWMGVDIVDGPGVDLLVFENAFYWGGGEADIFAELGAVGLSQDGVTFFEFPCDTSAFPFPGCAGRTPTYAHPDNDLDPTLPEEAGGDGFDLAEVGLLWARYVRVRDLAVSGSGPSAGFDLDAVSVVHSD